MNKRSNDNIDLDDIVFKDLNKEYGAYVLRKGYKRRIWISVLIAIPVLVAVFLLINYSNRDFLPPPPKVNTSTVHLKEYKLPKPPEKEKNRQPIPKKKEEILAKSTHYVSPKVLDKQIIPLVHEQPKSVQLEMPNLSANTIQGPDISVKPILKADNITAKDPLVNKAVDVIKDHASVKVQSLPHYLGGDSAWAHYLKSNIDIKRPLRNGAMPATYTVVIAFLVHADSTVSDFKIVQDPGYGTALEAMRIIRKSGKWIPGRKNNKAVTFAQVQTVIFKVNN